MNCVDCKYFDNDEDDFYGLKGTEWGLCRRYPPQHFIMPIDLWKYCDEPVYRSDFPEVFSSQESPDWCGEFQQKAKGENQNAVETIENQ